ncbi:succinate dehydrogenase, cytochrome b556 subunit [Pseudohoeflea coraliihabitans]|uniref:Succinate dehydrogenase cytochrome b556 subunit n=1 Tax=Pseudohoeflea coraliihabitans TaxID=2860393 RepID=A0ABS6WNV5_9HYPH|nr:succinate dehydrogenase, cytochrome b556 subunit [Pseudohoeflea sp. DP4N28-3]MBW3096780.1 succinate dehydrogenase, cytochrome b556 subunit [Pseudohoeflea sp. DP4N28-3]
MANVSQNRPISPHLSIYRLIPTMVMSILHRITGATLYVGTLFVVWWVVAAAAGPDHYDWVSAIYGSILGRLVLFGYTWVLLHHMLGGIRHLIWDTGHGLSPETSTRFAWATLAGSLSLTVLIWIVGFIV